MRKIPGEHRVMMGLARIEADQKRMAQLYWQKPKLAPAPQKPCDHGLFSDEALQLDLVEMLQEPDYDGL